MYFDAGIHSALSVDAMKVIIPVWQGGVSPLFDVSKLVLLVEIESGRELRRSSHALQCEHFVQRVGQVVSLGADMLICGAISGQLERMLRSTGVQVIPNICGAIDDVIAAFFNGSLMDPAFLMPGCQGRRRRSRNRFGGTRQ
jgi:predicted Fe-Mo cluster-binding NifX family protein